MMRWIDTVRLIQAKNPEPHPLYKPALREITIPNMMRGTRRAVSRQGGIKGEVFYRMTPEASTSVRSDMNARPAMKMESAILS